MKSEVEILNAFKRLAAVGALALFSLLAPACDATKPALPVKVQQRNALLAGGKVAVFKNTGSKTLSVLVVLENASFKERKRYDLVLSPGETKEIGGFEGWTVVPGETVRLTSDGHASASYTFVE